MKNRKAQGLNNIDKEVFKYGGGAKDKIQLLINKIYKMTTMPD